MDRWPNNGFLTKTLRVSLLKNQKNLFKWTWWLFSIRFIYEFVAFGPLYSRVYSKLRACQNSLFIVLLYCCTLFIVSVTIYCILFEYCGQVRKLAASRDIACVDCDGKGGSNVKQCQVNVENERERKRERELFRIYTLL